MFVRGWDAEALTTDERYATVAARAGACFVFSVALLALAQRKPWLLLFAPQERLLADDSRFGRFVSACVGFAWLAGALGPLLPLAALEAAADRSWPSAALLLAAAPVCALAPWLPGLLASLLPLAERRRAQALLRLPLVVAVAT